MEKPNRVGIMGGTFDPIHFGHLVTAEEARINFKLDKVVFVPAGNPPHKKNYKVSDAEHRYLMTALAINSNPYFEVSRIEIERSGYTYTVDTLRQFVDIYGRDTSLFFITGADAVLDILTWKDVKDVLSYCNFIAATRPGYPVNRLKEKLAEIKELYGTHVYLLEVTAMAISSTEIRRRIKEGISIKYLIPENVEAYIIKNGLYR
ncbi:nicotinate-nucleotide adenylyltransferase [Thermosediminibacter oceani]|uniref:Probable nicotinate-nucleotide adenylyltransferase n=1 Tax=Thermosediminibacter oceani (strain ATCC BAA-1034 / DSM 16646 / JW/IW-1228P) TaxID=555079 RepID=D9S2A7_THEOJ|nr:nicotinate-nucleotide adenylyltransferase [Thermosediminibacter oceani]ADL07534.1 nicotinate-nucleotide adenylyltransferase [Thermosediminibacter oceani DSM 16646]